MKEQKTNGGLFANRYFQIVFFSHVFLQKGIWIRNMAILWFVTERTADDPVAVSLIMVAEYAPIFLFSFIGGTFADRWRPKLTMIWSDLLSALSIFMIMIALFYSTWNIIYLVTFISAILTQFSQPSAMKLFKQRLPEEQIQQAMGVFQSMVAIFLIGGPALGIFIYQKFGIYSSISLMGLAFLLSALVLLRLPKDLQGERMEKSKAFFWKDLSNGIRYVWNSRVLSTMAGTLIMVGLATGLSQTLGYFIIVERLQQPKEFLQFMMMINGISMLIGGALIVVLGKKLLPPILVAIGLMVCALSNIGVGLSTSVSVTMVLQMFLGLAFPAIFIGVNTTILRWTDSAYIGRVNGVIAPMFTAGMVLTASFAGVLMKSFSLVVIYSGAGLFMIIGLCLLIPLRKITPRREASPSETEVVPANL